ncbi:hypothetical protein GCM10011495_09180 [Hymenobacter frigidus]|uniref:Uncharacterized protein n=1 Tax=Hymenobacter frigidus TaxID=1524095 RepID=A0ABQ2A032_9BACT|nr:hypothetical protein GCM10011495_09180 [Hymenobacter frigidus]
MSVKLSKTWEPARDVFLFCCYTGLRYFVSPLVQMDATVGQGSAGRVPGRIIATRFRKLEIPR